VENRDSEVDNLTNPVDIGREKLQKNLLLVSSCVRVSEPSRNALVARSKTPKSNPRGVTRRLGNQLKDVSPNATAMVWERAPSREIGEVVRQTERGPSISSVEGPRFCFPCCMPVFDAHVGHALPRCHQPSA
jgi:hypothetical protein